MELSSKHDFPYPCNHHLSNKIDNFFLSVIMPKKYTNKYRKEKLKRDVEKRPDDVEIDYSQLMQFKIADEFRKLAKKYS